MLVETYQAQLNRLLEQFDCKIQLPEEWAESFFDERGVLPTSFDERRQFARYHFRGKGILQVQRTLPTIQRSRGLYVIYTFDIARGGFAFLHTSQLFPCELCELWLPTQKLTVEITRCQYINSRCYLIGSRPTSRNLATLATQ